MFSIETVPSVHGIQLLLELIDVFEEILDVLVATASLLVEGFLELGFDLLVVMASL